MTVFVSNLSIQLEIISVIRAEILRSLKTIQVQYSCLINLFIRLIIPNFKTTLWDLSSKTRRKEFLLFQQATLCPVEISQQIHPSPHCLHKLRFSPPNQQPYLLFQEQNLLRNYLHASNTDYIYQIWSDSLNVLPHKTQPVVPIISD